MIEVKISPTAVALILKDDPYRRVFCSGLIIAENKILAAGHRIKTENGELDVSNIGVVAGEDKLIAYKTNGFEITGNMVWDIAILELTENMDIVNKPMIKVAHLPPPEVHVVGHKINFGGWESGSVVMHNSNQVTIHPHEVCQVSFIKD